MQEILCVKQKQKQRKTFKKTKFWNIKWKEKHLGRHIIQIF